MLGFGALHGGGGFLFIPSRWFDGPNVEGWDLGLCLMVATFIPHHCDPTGTDGIWGFAQCWWLPVHPPQDGLMDPM